MKFFRGRWPGSAKGSSRRMFPPSKSKSGQAKPKADLAEKILPANVVSLAGWREKKIAEDLRDHRFDLLCAIHAFFSWQSFLLDELRRVCNLDTGQFVEIIEINWQWLVSNGFIDDLSNGRYCLADKAKSYLEHPTALE